MKLVKEHINEAIKHLTPKTKEEIIESFIKMDDYEFDDETFQYIWEIQRKCGLDEVSLFSEDDETRKKLAQKFIDILEHTLERELEL